MDEKKLINILSNDREGAYQAVEHLIQKGHQDIAIIEGKEGFNSTLKRRDGYVKALIDYQIPIKSEYMVKGNYDMQSGYQAMEKLLSMEKPPTAVFCSNDDMALGAMNSVFAHQLKVPDDVSIIGFDDIGFAQYTTPQLTTVKRPIEEISIIGAEKLVDLMEQPSERGELIFVNTELIVRNSVNE